MVFLCGDGGCDGSVTAALQRVEQQLRQDLKELWLNFFPQ
jgi:hypothetical protein